MKFWNGMSKKSTASPTDKILVGDVASDDPQYMNFEDMPFSPKNNATLTGTTHIDELIAGGINLSLWGVTGGLHGLRNDGDGFTEVLGDDSTKTQIQGTEITLLSETINCGFNAIYDPGYGLGLLDYLSNEGYVQYSLYSGNADWAGGADSSNNLQSGSWWGDIDYDTAYSSIMIGSGTNEWISGTDIIMIAPYDEVSNGGSGLTGLFFLITQSLFRRDSGNYLQLNPDEGYNSFISGGRHLFQHQLETNVIEFGNATDFLKLLSAKTETSTTSTNANFVYIEKPNGTLAKMSKANFKTWLNN